MGCHENHVFKYSQNKFIQGDNFLGNAWGIWCMAVLKAY